MRPGAFSPLFRMHTTSLGFDDVSDLSLRNSTNVRRIVRARRHLDRQFVVATFQQIKNVSEMSGARSRLARTCTVELSKRARAHAHSSPPLCLHARRARDMCAPAGGLLEMESRVTNIGRSARGQRRHWQTTRVRVCPIPQGELDI